MRLYVMCKPRANEAQKMAAVRKSASYLIAIDGLEIQISQITTGKVQKK